MIEKYWISEEKGNDRIILLADQMIYKGNPKIHDFKNQVNKIEAGQIPDGLFSIPYDYITDIQLEEGENYLNIKFNKDSSSYLKITDGERKKEIFAYLKENIPDINYRFDQYSKFKSALKPLTALLVLTIIFLWSFYVARQLETGEYIGSQWVIIAALASFGSKKLVMIYSIILIIIGLAAGRKMKNPYKKHVLYF